jgi:DNA-nicking Smr family endonuclease
VSHPRGLSAEEAEAWEKLAATVTPLVPPRAGERDRRPKVGDEGAAPIVADAPPRTPPPQTRPKALAKPSAPLHPAVAPPPPPRGGGLDSHWDRRLKAGQVDPDFSLDLHGHTLDSAWNRLDSGLFQAKAMGARLVLLVTGKSRPVDAADRGTKRGAIRAKVLDWLAAGPHGSDIAAIRTAHRKHGGDGALYLVIKRRR